MLRIRSMLMTEGYSYGNADYMGENTSIFPQLSLSARFMYLYVDLISRGHYNYYTQCSLLDVLILQHFKNIAVVHIQRIVDCKLIRSTI